MVLTLDKFIKKANKNRPIHINRGVFEYCLDEKLVRGVDDAYFITLNAGKKLVLTYEFPTNIIEADKVEEIYTQLLITLINQGFLVCQYLSKEQLKKYSLHL